MLGDVLKDMRVIDMGQYIPGPFACLLLSDLGAEVIKIEPPGGDPMRLFGPLDADGVSPLYKVLNRNKTVVTLDLKSAEGKAGLATLIGRSHGLVESFRPGVMERLGFGEAALDGLNRALVHVMVSGFGQTGPWRDRAGHDMTYLALSGALAMSGTADQPVAPFPPLADHAGAMMAVVAMLAGLLRRLRSGRGGHYDLSLYESARALNAMGLALAARGAPTARGHDLLNGGAAYYKIYGTADGGHLAVAPIEPKFWAAFCAALDRPDLVARQSEPLPQTALIAELDALFATRDRQAWMAVLGPADCCVEAVLQPDEVLTGVLDAPRGMVHSGTDGLVDLLLPILLAESGPTPRQPLREATIDEAIALWDRVGH
ncbi:carnitine dehydratase [Rhodospirillum rubrum]|uniref:CaiB/BaiF CoA transferase family protein n=1 Tax=Rhodospirillum rubrum TaxID=1085 RepID=UPI00190813E1|nr:CoA transferase [Rhodospirillum rubrum]MBK1664047.1 carnitine dehydratase [Rhodospirillum rubrum]MBK1675477.1 carnitine dehydratase [Rhodospirillum rubrum]